MRMLSIDGSLTATGFVVLEFGAELHDEKLLEEGFIATKREKEAKRHTYQADQDGMRIDAIVAEMLRLIRRHEPHIVAIEAPAGAQHANAAKALALVYGALRGALRALGITPLMVQAHHAKIAAAGHRHSTKESVLAAMQARFRITITGNDKRREAIADALAVACSAMGEPTVQALRRSSVARDGLAAWDELARTGAPAQPDPAAEEGSLFG